MVFRHALDRICIADTEGATVDGVVGCKNDPKGLLIVDVLLGPLLIDLQHMVYFFPG